MANLTLPVTLTNGTVASATDVMSDLTRVADGLNGAVDAGIFDQVGVTVTGGTVRRGKSIIATTEARTNTAYGLMPTPDRVQNVVLPTDGLIMVAYEAVWQGSVAGAANAAVFVGASQLRGQANSTSAAPAVQEASYAGTGTTNTDKPLTTGVNGLTGNADSATAYTGDVTTGQMVAPLSIFAAAGTYDISVQFKASSGSVTAKNRKLWVWTMGF